MINFPTSISEPLKKINTGVKAMINNDFSDKIRLSTNDEFQELAASINLMAEKIAQQTEPKSHEQTNESKQVNEELLLYQINALIKSIHPIINNLELSKHNEVLLKQAKAFTNIEKEIAKIIE